MGIMTSYGSYNFIRKPIILDNCIIALTNSSVSIISGFAVWSIVGFLRATGSSASDNTGGTDLVFIAYPVATLQMEGSAFWTFLLGLTLFLLGVDSAFSMVEAVATVLHDTKTFANWSRTLIAFLLCFIGLAISALFCTNWGYILFDSIDHYLGNYLLLLVGIMQCGGVGWAFDADRCSKKGENYRKSLSFLTYGYSIFLFICGVWSINQDTGKYGMLAFLGCLSCFVLPISFLYSELRVMEWYTEIVMCGVRRIGYSMSKLGRDNYGEEKGKEKWYEQYFVFYWCVTIKYLIPAALWFILLYVIKKDLTKPYGNYKLYWQLIGLMVPLIGLLAFLVNLCCCVEEEVLNEEEFDFEWHEPTAELIGEDAYEEMLEG
jgi:SNF family Na+-dependent transporter